MPALAQLNLEQICAVAMKAVKFGGSGSFNNGDATFYVENGVGGGNSGKNDTFISVAEAGLG